MKKIVKVFLVCLIFFSCTQREKKSQDLIDKYNNRIEKGYQKSSEWVKSPLLIVNELCSLGQVSKETDIHLKKINQGEVPTEVEILIKERGVLDDSNPENSYYFKFVLIEGRWKVVE